MESDLITRNFQQLAVTMTRLRELELAALPYQDFLETLYWKVVGSYVRLLHHDRCDRCGRVSGLQVHHQSYDHVGAEYRHLEDLAVLCEYCHRIVHDLKRMLNLYDFDRDRLRPGQRKALDVIFERCRTREPYTAIVIPTRYGKSDLMRVSAIQLNKHGLIGVAFGLSPFSQLTEQLDSHQQWIECIERYDLPRTSAHRIVECLEDDYAANGECFRCATLQFVICHIAIFEKKAAAAKAAGKPLLFFIDECHFTSDQNRWGECAERLAKAGALIVLLTATAIREDARPPQGFQFERVVVNPDATRKIPGRGSTPDKVKIDVYKGQDIETRIIPDHETTFAEAWAESPSPLCKVTFSAFDVYLSDTDVQPEVGDEDGDWIDAQISTMSLRQARLYLGLICRSPVVIREGASRLVRLLLEMRRIDPTVAAMVFCDCDRNGGDDFVVNRAAKNIKRAIEDAPGGSGLNVVIATSASDEKGGLGGKALISKFQHGSGDVLIVKQMGGAGLHCPRIKVILDLSPVRALASWTQRAMRAATPHNGFRVCILITPADCLAEACFQRMIASQGGASRFEGDLITSYEVDRQEREWLHVAGTGDADFRDNVGNLGEAEQYEDVRSVRELFPELHTLTDPEIAVRVVGLADRIRNRKGRVVDIEREIEDLHKACVDLAGDIAVHRMGGHYQPDQFPRFIARVWQDVHQRVGIDTITDVTDLKVLQNVQAALIEISRSETGTA